jgi:hypothetical protein
MILVVATHVTLAMLAVTQRPAVTPRLSTARHPVSANTGLEQGTVPAFSLHHRKAWLPKDFPDRPAGVERQGFIVYRQITCLKKTRSNEHALGRHWDGTRPHGREHYLERRPLSQLETPVAPAAQRDHGKHSTP